MVSEFEENFRTYVLGLLKLKEQGDQLIPEKNEDIMKGTDAENESFEKIKEKLELIERYRDHRVHLIFELLNPKERKKNLCNLLQELNDFNIKMIYRLNEIEQFDLYLIHLSNNISAKHKQYLQSLNDLESAESYYVDGNLKTVDLKKSTYQRLKKKSNKILKSIRKNESEDVQEMLFLIRITHLITCTIDKIKKAVMREQESIGSMLKNAVKFISPGSKLFIQFNNTNEYLNSLIKYLSEEEPKIKSKYELEVRIIPREIKRFDEFITRWWRLFGHGKIMLQLDFNTDQIPASQFKNPIMIIDHHGNHKGVTATHNVFHSGYIKDSKFGGDITKEEQEKKFRENIRHVGDHIDLDMLLSHFVFKNPNFSRRHEDLIKEMAEYCDYLVGSNNSRKYAYVIIGMLDYFAKQIYVENGGNENNLPYYSFLKGRVNKEKLFNLVFAELRDVLSSRDVLSVERYRWFFNYETMILSKELEKIDDLKIIEQPKIKGKKLLLAEHKKPIPYNVFYSMLNMMIEETVFIIVRYYVKNRVNWYSISINPVFNDLAEKAELNTLGDKLNLQENKSINSDKKEFWKSRDCVLFNIIKTNLTRDKIFNMVKNHVRKLDISQTEIEYAKKN